MAEQDLTIPEAYHRWYYDNRVWEQVHWMGIPCLKSVSDLWSYQEIIAQLRPGLIVEFGTRHGGAAMYFAHVGTLVRPDCRVFTVDTDHTDLHTDVRSHPSIDTFLGRSTDPVVLSQLHERRDRNPGPVFAILDSDHSKNNVLAEMKSLRDFLVTGDYLVVEDGNINGHPVLPGWGEGPWEAIEAYFDQYPGDYVHDITVEERFGFTFAPRGFLKRL